MRPQEFKKVRDVKALRRFLENECVGATSSSNTSTNLNARRALFNQLQDSEEEGQSQTSSSGKTSQTQIARW